jgi:hypothetical protein
VQDQSPELSELSELEALEALDQDLRAARVRIREVGSLLRQALADDDRLAGHTGDTPR